jgi:hypothetical protein
MRQHTQLDLRIVGGDQQVTRRSDETAPHLAPLFGARGNILQVGRVAAQPTGRGAKLVVIGMNPAGLRVNQRRQFIDVGRFEFAQATVTQINSMMPVVSLACSSSSACAVSE